MAAFCKRSVKIHTCHEWLGIPPRSTVFFIHAAHWHLLDNGSRSFPPKFNGRSHEFPLNFCGKRVFFWYLVKRRSLLPPSYVSSPSFPFPPPRLFVKWRWWWEEKAAAAFLSKDRPTPTFPPTVMAMFKRKLKAPNEMCGRHGFVCIVFY